ncbi:Protein of unknown function DUF2518 [Stanieria cyanosphaera PCC 7437]|uniref:Ycf51-like protein n=1 Tax=Stanieria cyanosphaera (strain ATCC 29371 / PCC 7437) TaxID=111780 RepID=K9XQT9_STAC7|nr:Ycf51 family protein [Stanieria cyanosphaera]AFZ34893.1 Protein of unknown function DUF2518 [Stanieria cyanosphaera PCC 7437]
MKIPTDLSTYTQWSGILTLVLLLITILAFILGLGFRFRLFGATSFMAVVTASIFALSLGLFVHTEIPGAIRYSLVYDNGANQAVVAVSPEIEESQIEPTLRQAANNLYSFGRNGRDGENKFTIKLRTLLHPEPGISVPLYLGQIKRSLSSREDDNMQIEIFTQNIAQLKEAQAKSVSS